MNEATAWLAWLLILLAFGIPGAVWFGIQIGYERALDDLDKKEEDHV